MRITKVSVKKLFGIFNHEIPLHTSRITIVQGPNGFGKTILLTMLHGLFDSKYEAFHKVPFDEFRVDLSTGDAITVKKRLMEPQSKASGLAIVFNEHEALNDEPYRPQPLEAYRQQFDEEIDSISDLMQIESDLWYSRKQSTILTMDEVIETYNLHSKLYGTEKPRWFEQITSALHTRFIHAHRLQVRRVAHLPLRSVFGGPDLPRDSGYAVDSYSTEIAKSIQGIRSEYGVLSQKLDGSFPNKVISKGGSSEIDPAIESRLEQLRERRLRLIKLGLLDEDTHEIVGSEETESDLATAFFTQYFQDSDVKLAVFDTMSSQVTKLMEIVNRRFQFKTLSIHKESGFVVKADDGTEIPISSLSSGEQHELVLMYQLLFHVKEDSLILIDEPELSLHVTWQRDFLSDIQSITELRKFDVLVATHSPQIIGSRRDMTVRLRRISEGATVDV